MRLQWGVEERAGGIGLRVESLDREGKKAPRRFFRQIQVGKKTLTGTVVWEVQGACRRTKVGSK